MMNEERGKENDGRWRPILRSAGKWAPWVLAIATVIWAAGGSANQAKTNVVRIDDHELRLREIENDLAGIAADVRWIRADMETHH